MLFISVTTLVSLLTTYVFILSDIFVDTLMISFLSVGSGEGQVFLVLLNLTEFRLVKFGFDSPWNYFKTWFFNIFHFNFFSTFQSIFLRISAITIHLVDSLFFLSFSFFV